MKDSFIKVQLHKELQLEKSAIDFFIPLKHGLVVQIFGNYIVSVYGEPHQKF